MLLLLLWGWSTAGKGHALTHVSSAAGAVVEDNVVVPIGSLVNPRKGEFLAGSDKQADR